MTDELEILQALIDAHEQPVFALDRELRYTAFNRAHAHVMLALYGAEIARGGRLTDYQTVVADRETALANLERALAGERVVAAADSGEPGRERRHFDIVHTPLTDAGGAVVGVVIRAYDVTERRRVEDGLLESDARLRRSLAAAKAGTWEWDIAGGGNTWSDETRDLYGIDLEGREPSYERWLEAVHPDDREAAAAAVRAAAATGAELNAEWRVNTRDGSLRWLVSRGSPERDAAGEVVRYRGVVMDITARKEAERAVRRGQSELRALVDAVPDIVFQVDRDYRLVVANAPFTRAIVSAEGRPLAPGDPVLAPEYPEDSRRMWRDYYDRALAGEAFMAETTAAMADGTHFMENHLNPVREDGGEVSGVVVTSRDVTERRRADETHRRLEEDYRTLAENSPDLIARFDRDLRHAYVNRAAARAASLLPEEYIGKTIAEVGVEKQVAGLWERRIREVLETGRPLDIVDAFPVQGETRHFHTRLTAEPAADGSIGSVLSVARDVTEARRAEEAVRESEARYRGYFEQTLVGAAVTSPEKGWIDANEAICDMLGYTHDELTRLTWAELTHPDDLAADVALFERVLAGEIDGYRLEKRFLRKDGDVVDVDLSVQCRRKEDGAVDYLLALLLDVTEKRHSESRVRATLDSMFDPHVVLEAVRDEAGTIVDFVFTDANAAACELNGLPYEELVGTPLLGLHPAAGSSALLKLYARVVETGAPLILDDWSYPQDLLGGDLRRYDVRAVRLGDGLSQTWRDVTERRRAESVRAFLAHTGSGPQDEPFFEALARYLAESLGMFYVCIDRLEGDGLTARTVAVWCEDHFEDNVAYALEDTPCGEVVGKTVCCFPAGVRRLFPRDQALEDLRAESYIGVTLFGHSGRPIGLIAVIGRAPLGDRALAEATLELVAARAAGELERLDAEAALRETRDRLELAQRASGAGAWDWDVVTSVIEWSPEMFALFGLDAQTDAASFNAWNGAMHPDDLEVANARIATALTDHAMLDSEYRIVKTDGEVRWINALGQGVYDEQGEPLRMSGICMDISERKRAEDEIRRLNADLERRVDERTRDLTAANAELEELVHSISHDLRSPLRALSGFSDLLRMDYGDVIDDTGRDYLRRIRDAALHLGDLMDALLSLSRIGRRDLDLRDVDLSALAGGVAKQLRDADPERAAELEIENGLVAHSDPALCEIIVQNLLDNAWKFSAGASPARLSFRAECIDGRRTYVVRDNGAGFEPEYVGKLFMPFERLHTTEEFPGTGIGLATVRRAVTRLGGRCWAEGEPGGGAQVYFNLGESC
ncbi:MAG: PAS domain S-box protein [Actinomycetes bacterium]